MDSLGLIYTKKVFLFT